jgi:hypothetical protein
VTVAAPLSHLPFCSVPISTLSVLRYCKAEHGTFNLSMRLVSWYPMLLSTTLDCRVFFNAVASIGTRRRSWPFRGLGFIDSREDTLTVCLEREATQPTSDIIPGKGRSKRSRKVQHKSASPAMKVAEIELAQDKTALRPLKSDTGGVLWQARRVFPPCFVTIMKLNAVRRAA